MARSDRCDLCGSRDCNGRCRRSDLVTEIHRLRRENEELRAGEIALEEEADRLVAELREAAPPPSPSPGVGDEVPVTIVDKGQATAIRALDTATEEIARLRAALAASEAARVEAERERDEAKAGWRCFQCGEFFTTKEAAADHFFDPEDEGPCCVSPLRSDEAARMKALKEAQDDAARWKREVEEAEEDRVLLRSYEAEIGRYFGKVGGVVASTPHQAWLRFEAEQGRAEAAESRAGPAREALRMIRKTHADHETDRCLWCHKPWPCSDFATADRVLSAEPSETKEGT